MAEANFEPQQPQQDPGTTPRETLTSFTRPTTDSSPTGNFSSAEKKTPSGAPLSFDILNEEQKQALIAAYRNAERQTPGAVPKTDEEMRATIDREMTEGLEARRKLQEFLDREASKEQQRFATEAQAMIDAVNSLDPEKAKAFRELYGMFAASRSNTRPDELNFLNPYRSEAGAPNTDRDTSSANPPEAGIGNS